jgi:predicted MFS family arabinose efflux permease
MMTTVLIVSGFYIFAGSVFAGWWDDQEMKKHVPFGEVPAILPLHAIRVFSFLLLTLTGLAIVLTGFIVAGIPAAWHRVRFLWLIRRLKRKTYMIPGANRLLDEIAKARRK